MALDPSIILQGRTPDMVARYSQGLATGQQQNQIGRENALAGLYREQGAGIMAGDQGALNALAGIDPTAAMGMQSAQLGMQSTRLGMDAQRQGMAATQQRMDMLTRGEKLALADRAAAMGAAERAAAAAEIENAVKMGMTAQSSEQWDALMSQMGAADLVGQFGQRQGLAARYMEIADVFKMVTPEVPEWRTATPQEAAANGAVAGQINVKTGKFDAQNPPSNTVLTTNPDGSVTFQQGAGASAKPFTEGQSKDNVFVTRAQGALAVLEPVAGELASRQNRVLDAVPLGIGRELQSDSYQVAKNAGDEYLSALLRKDTGAAITEGEQALYGVTYLPQPGDGEPVLKAKAEARSRALEAMKSGMSAEQLEAVARADAATVRATAGGQGSQANKNAPVIVDGFQIEEAN